MTQVESYSPRRAGRASGSGSGRRPLPGDPGEIDPGRPADDDDLGQDARRGSHATTYGQGFSWLLIWTILGTLIPGTGLIAAGRRRLGVLLLGLIALILLGLVAFVELGDVKQQGISLALDPQKLLLLAVTAGFGAVLWALVVLLTNTQLRRYAVLSSGQSAFSWVVVVALVIGIAVPAYKVSSYAMITRSVVTSKSIFGNDPDGTSTRPDTTKADPWASQPRMNVLLIGSDAGSDRTGGACGMAGARDFTGGATCGTGSEEGASVASSASPRRRPRAARASPGMSGAAPSSSPATNASIRSRARLTALAASRSRPVAPVAMRSNRLSRR